MQRHILIVEDDESIRMLVEVVAQRSGYLTSSVTNGVEAISALSPDDAGKYCAVVLDLMLPHVSGYDVIGHLRDKSLAIPVVVITAAVKSLEQQRLDPDIVCAVVTKPFDLDKLTAALKVACDGPPPPGLHLVV